MSLPDHHSSATPTNVTNEDHTVLSGNESTNAQSQLSRSQTPTPLSPTLILPPATTPTTAAATETAAPSSTTTLRTSIGADSEQSSLSPPVTSMDTEVLSDTEVPSVSVRQDLLSSIRANAGNPPSNVLISTATPTWPSSSSRTHTSLSLATTGRRYPQPPLRSSQLGASQQHSPRAPLPLPEREDSSRPRAITFGTLKKASMSHRTPSFIPTEKKSKMVALPSYLQYTTFKQHFQPEGGIGEHGLGSSLDREHSKRRRLLTDTSRRRHTHIHHDSDSSVSSSGDSSSGSSSSSGSDSSYENDSTFTPKSERPGKHDTDASSIRANRHIPPQCGVYYYEVLIKSKGQQGDWRWEPQSWGYHGDDGNSFEGCGNGRPFGPVFTTGDTIGCGVNFRDMSLFFTKNGVHLGVAFRNLKGTLYPTVGMRTAGEIIEANFGQREFVFDIDNYVKNEKVEAWQLLERSIQAAIVEKKQLGNISQNLSQLVLSYMIHHGYSESAKQLAGDLALQSSQSQGPTGTISSQAQIDSTNCLPMIADSEKRKVIRNKILAGEIDKAMELLEKHYPGITADYGDMLLQLRCRKFVEMVSLASTPLRKLDQGECKKGDTKGKSTELMDVDQDPSIKPSSSMEADQEDLEGLGMLKDAIKYGQFLQEHYKDNRRRSVQDMLVDAFSVLAYTDVEKQPGSESSHQAKSITREKVANTVNRAILSSQNQPTTAPIETLYRQTTAIMSELTSLGVGAAAFYDVDRDCLE
ncbi:hypothetical protein BGZ80_004814 [Entomortierella chlamydospora]|uniref:Protein SSH4 n=1 Tax=Entomortierella chlamydospora TaxID=101097 RepID=A0A9P6T2Z2_9FUNG|nr:hypothetical protein BGZ80_004814 [Entomortierella chlamydospora]